MSMPMPLERICRMMEHLDGKRIDTLKCVMARHALGWRPEPLNALFSTHSSSMTAGVPENVK